MFKHLMHCLYWYVGVYRRPSLGDLNVTCPMAVMVLRAANGGVQFRYVTCLSASTMSCGNKLAKQA
jgi:hypothetical protein